MKVSAKEQSYLCRCREEMVMLLFILKDLQSVFYDCIWESQVKTITFVLSDIWQQLQNLEHIGKCEQDNGM